MKLGEAADAADKAAEGETGGETIAAAAIRAAFTFSYIWSIGGVLDEDAWPEFNESVR